MAKAKIINATPHPIVVRTDAGNIIFPTSDLLARVSVKETRTGDINGIPCVAQTLGNVEGLPNASWACPSCGAESQDPMGGSCDCNAPYERIHYIVSAMVRNASVRDDLIAPDTGKTCIRDEQGRIQAVTQFIN